jgi:predicted Fe-Mo cluster-binding NifX family protein
VKVAIPRFGESVAPCFGYSATITIFTIRKGKVVDHADFCLQSREILDRVRLLRDQEVGTLICGGVQEPLEDVLRASGVRVISWVNGRVEELLECFLRGELVARVGCL